MGLFIGASVLTILEIFDYLYEVCCVLACLICSFPIMWSSLQIIFGQYIINSNLLTIYLKNVAPFFILQVFKDKVLGYFLRKRRPHRSASDNLVIVLPVLLWMWACWFCSYFQCFYFLFGFYSWMLHASSCLLSLAQILGNDWWRWPFRKKQNLVWIWTNIGPEMGKF